MEGGKTYQRPLENVPLVFVGTQYKKCAVERVWPKATRHAVDASFHLASQAPITT